MSSGWERGEVVIRGTHLLAGFENEEQLDRKGCHGRKASLEDIIGTKAQRSEIGLKVAQLQKARL